MEQSRDTGNIGYTKHRTKTNKTKYIDVNYNKRLDYNN